VTFPVTFGSPKDWEITQWPCIEAEQGVPRSPFPQMQVHNGLVLNHSLIGCSAEITLEWSVFLGEAVTWCTLGIYSRSSTTSERVLQASAVLFLLERTQFPKSFRLKRCQRHYTLARKLYDIIQIGMMN